MTLKTDVLIAGGGIIGSALAWGLAVRGVRGITVVDLDLAGLYASSELNAGGVRATWWQAVNVETCAATLDFFRTHREDFGFREQGYLWLYESEALLAKAKAKRRMQNRYDLGVELLSPAELEQRFAVLDRAAGRIVGATFSPRDGLVNPNAVRQWYRREAEALGVRFLNRHYITGVSTARLASSTRRVAWLELVEVAASDPIDRDGAIEQILTTHSVPSALGLPAQRLECELVVNCLGAWSPLFSAKIGISDVTEPTRRQICLLGVQHEDQARLEQLRSLGMVVDASDLYFHPEGQHILAGYSIPDEAPGFDFHYDGDAFFTELLWPRLQACCSLFERCKPIRGWAGLYAVTPDRSGIAGPVRGFSNLFEAHSFTGRGVMQSYGVATALAEWIDTGRAPGSIASLGRERFVDPDAWLEEDLHI